MFVVPRARAWCFLVDFLPALLVLFSVCLKTAAVTVFASAAWWNETHSISDWIQKGPGVLAATVSAPLVLVGVTLLLPRRPRYLALTALDVGASALVLIDLIHLGYYGDLPSVLMVQSSAVVRDILPSLRTLVKASHTVLAGDIAVALILLPFYWRMTSQRTALETSGRIQVGALAILVGLLLAVPSIRFALSRDTAIRAAANLRRDVCVAIGVLPYHVLDVVLHLRTERTVIPDAQVLEISGYLERRRHKVRSPLFGAAKGRNLIIVLAESLQGFPLDLTVNGQPVTPRLGALSKESLYFTDFYEQTHLGTTSDAEFIAMQSLHSAPAGAVANLYTTNRFRGIAQVLQQHGYKTFSAVGVPGYVWNMNLMHPALGFERTYLDDHYDLTERIGEWLADHQFLRQSWPLLERAAEAEPFFAYLLSVSNHHPWQIPPRFQTLDVTGIGSGSSRAYLQSVHYFDAAVGDFVEKLRSSGLLDRSMFVIMSDHQAFLDREALGHLFDSSEMARYPEQLLRKKVHLLVRLPDGAAANVRTVTGSQIDIAPTLMSLLGVDGWPAVMLGRDLTAHGSAPVVFRDGSVFDGRIFLQNGLGATPSLSCHDVSRGVRIPCSPFERLRTAAWEELESSDLILQGDLIPRLTDGVPASH